MSACQHIAISAPVEDRLLCGNGFWVGLVTCLFVISRSAVRIRTLASLLYQQLNNSGFCTFGWSQLAKAGVPGSSFLDTIQNKNIAAGGKLTLFTKLSQYLLSSAAAKLQQGGAMKEQSGSISFTMTEILSNFNRFSTLDMIQKTAIITGHKLMEDSGRSLGELVTSEIIDLHKERVTVKWRVR